MKLGKRIIIIGSGGSGKSTLAMQLKEITGLPVTHLDREFWQAGWVKTPEEEWKEKQIKLVSGEEWIMDGNYDNTMDIRIEKADTIILLDISNIICLFRAIKRRFIYAGKTRPDMNEGCPEKIDLEFVKWIWNFPKVTKPKVMEKLERNKHKNIIILKSRGTVKNFLEDIQNAK